MGIIQGKFENSSTRPNGQVIWKCVNSGHQIVGGTTPPKECVLCKDSQVLDPITKEKRARVVGNRSKGRFSYNIGDMQKLAEEKGGKCLSLKFLGTTVKLEWKCNNGHIWKSIPANLIHHGSWCPECFKQRRKK